VISKKFNAVELYGLRELMVLRDLKRIDEYEAEWNRLHGVEPGDVEPQRPVLQPTTSAQP
jgi:hypothetical protein